MTKDNDDPLGWPDSRHLLREEAARYIRALGFRMEPATLAKYAWRGDGPVITYMGAKPYYLPPDLRAWLQQRTRRSTSTTKTRAPTRRSPRAPLAGGRGDAHRKSAERRVEHVIWPRRARLERIDGALGEI